MRNSTNSPFSERFGVDPLLRRFFLNETPLFGSHRDGILDNPSSDVKPANDPTAWLVTRWTESPHPCSVPENEQTYMDDFRARLKKLRLDRGWTQAEMAEALLISEANYAKYENRKGRFPIYLLPRLALMTGRDMQYLVTGRPFPKATAATTRQRSRKFG